MRPNGPGAVPLRDLRQAVISVSVGRRNAASGWNCWISLARGWCGSGGRRWGLAAAQGLPGGLPHKSSETRGGKVAT